MTETSTADSVQFVASAAGHHFCCDSVARRCFCILYFFWRKTGTSQHPFDFFLVLVLSVQYFYYFLVCSSSWSCSPAHVWWNWCTYLCTHTAT